jgi:hypothetical protein
MHNKLFRGFAMTALATALAIASPALAFHGGGGGGGGRGGGWGGGMHSMGGGWSHMGGMGSHYAMAPYSRTAFSPHPSHFAFHDRDGFRFRDRDDFRHHRFHRFAFFGAPYYYADYGDDGCVRQVWTRSGLQWVNVCGYGNYGY